MTNFVPDATYVTRLLNDLKQDLQGLHERIEESERLRYLEDEIKLGNDEAKSGIEVRIGASAELINNVMGALTSNQPTVRVEGHKDSSKRADNESKREKFLNRFLETRNMDAGTFFRFADSLVANGVAYLKAARVEYPSQPRLRRRKPNNTFDETEQEHLQRVKALKRMWGPPIEVIDIHPLSVYPRRGQGNRIAELVEHSYKPKSWMYRNYGIEETRDGLTRAKLDSRLLDSKVAQLARATTGFPDEDIKSLPYGTSTQNLCLCTEYWSPDLHQVYIDRRLVYQEETPHVRYFMGRGQQNSSNDPDKIGFGVAELMRHNEPAINRAITRMLEANELVGRRPTIELPEGSTDGFEAPDTDQGGELVPRQFRFKADVAEALPAGAKVVNPFQGVEGVYASMPVIQFLMAINGEHGVSPLFKGIPPGTQGSGYRDNSLYMMAKSQLQYLIDAYKGALTELVRWVEAEIVDMDETVYLGEYELSPKDISDWPATVTVSLEPMIPQNMIAEGTFWDRMWASRHVPRRVVRERGFNEQDPAQLEKEVMLENIREMLMPQLYLDVLQSVQAVQPPGPQGDQAGRETPPEQTDQVNVNTGDTFNNRNGDQARPGAGRDIGRSEGGMTRQGQSREPVRQPAQSPEL